MEQEDTVAFTKKIEFPDYSQISLTPIAKKKTANWTDFSTAEIEVERMLGFTVRDVAQNAENIAQSMSSLEKTLPEELHTKPVLARIAVLVSLTGMLQQSTANPVAKADEIETFASKIPPAFENLKIHVNEAYREGLEDFQAEVEPEKPILSPIIKSGPIQKEKK
ncbi:MAG TPA: hypothetical protein VFM82_08845 [Flavobacteriaceae bacterium]|nr:hypothetical protein [Flavobacteriaceae bacterium]